MQVTDIFFNCQGTGIRMNRYILRLTGLLMCGSAADVSIKRSKAASVILLVYIPGFVYDLDVYLECYRKSRYEYVLCIVGLFTYV